MMEDEIPLPDIPLERPSTHDMSSPPRHYSTFHFPKKHRDPLSSFDHIYGDIPSSDPPLFSSDDLPSASVENYQSAETGPKRKRHYRGTWWGEKFESKRQRTEWHGKKVVDSGVWMNSDDDVVLDSSTAGDASDTEVVVKSGTPSRRPHPLSNSFFPCAIPRQRPEPVPISRQHAEKVIFNCIEEGHEVVDLSHLSIETVPFGLLGRLRELTKLPIFDGVSELSFGPLTPDLRVFLSSNGLSALPRDLFDLDNLKELSLRNNSIKKFPECLKKLTNLEQLNIAANGLSYFPWELLELMEKGNLRHLIARPNPFYLLDESSYVRNWFYSHPEGNLRPEAAAFIAPEYEGEPPPEAYSPILVAVGRVQLLNSEGGPVISKSNKATLSGTAPIEASPYAGVSTLLEISVRSLSRLRKFPDFMESGAEKLPDHLIRYLERAKEVRDSGGRTCSICCKDYIIPRAEWVEWWDCTPHEMGLKPRRSRERLRPLPFMRRGCSWLCVRDADSDMVQRELNGV